MQIPCYYLLVAVDADKSRVAAPSAYEVALHRLRLGKWGFGDRTPFRRSIDIGDRVLIYIAGRRLNGGTVIASAQVCSPARSMSRSLAATIDSPSEARNVVTHFYIGLDHVEIFPCPVELKKFQSHLSFVTKPNTPKWGTRLQTGAIRLTEADYKMLKVSSE